MATALIAAAALLGAGPARAQAGDSPHSTEEAQAKQKLDDVRAEIRKITETQKQIAAQKNDTTEALRAQELKIAATAKEVRALDQKLAGQQARLEQLLRQRDALDATLKTQREALAALLRSAYAIGRNEELRLLLAQDEVGSIGRLLAYYRYFERARIAEIEHLLHDLEALAQVQSSIEQETAQIKESRDARMTEADRLEAERAERRQVLATLEATLHDQQGRLAALGKDEKGLLRLLEKLRDVFADIPKQIAGAEPFAQLRGRLLMPLRGSLQTGPAHDEGDSHGVLIAAAEGGEVHAVSHGRVVFADWLRGYGLLLIVDHGDGYLSLYGCNESLLKDVGDWVNANEVIATSGASGGRRTPGLYFELRHDGKPMDARAWLKPSRAR
ncbi:MAG TPA: peptidoglycan DD-metalloendopeptidase family protein [Rudaea sp.]|nr:peptidoglycan DD-metalloendopeptidase family protein [Rudaea sp.]